MHYTREKIECNLIGDGQTHLGRLYADWLELNAEVERLQGVVKVAECTAGHKRLFYADWSVGHHTCPVCHIETIEAKVARLKEANKGGVCVGAKILSALTQTPDARKSILDLLDQMPENMGNAAFPAVGPEFSDLYSAEVAEAFESLSSFLRIHLSHN